MNADLLDILEEVEQLRVKEMIHGEGIGRPTGLLEAMQETWLPATSRNPLTKAENRNCVLSFIKGQLHQLWVCTEARKAKWRKISKSKEK